MSAHADAPHHGPPIANRSSRIEATVLGMFLFIASEAMLFGAFFTAYFFVRVVNPDAPAVWPPPPYEFPVFVATVNTAILVFNMSDGAFASVFFGLTGLHGAHVFIGLTLLTIAAVRAFKGHFTPDHYHGVEIPGIYWHFVDVMWIVVWAAVYIL